MTRFVVLATQRSGSTWVIDMLNSHSSVTAYSELLLADGRGSPQWGGATDKPFFETYEASHGGSAPAASVLERYLDDVLADRPGTAAVGFKLMYGQVTSRPGVTAYLARRDVRVVHVIRNLLDVVLSEEAAARRDLFHSRDASAVRPVRLTLDGSLPARLHETEGQRNAMRTRFSGPAFRYLEVAYEKLVTDQSTYDHVLGFLGVPSAPLASSLVRLNRSSHRDLIQNYEQVRDWLKGTRYQELLR